jgi:hypothetical protein
MKSIKSIKLIVGRGNNIRKGYMEEELSLINKKDVRYVTCDPDPNANADIKDNFDEIDVNRCCKFNSIYVEFSTVKFIGNKLIKKANQLLLSGGLLMFEVNFDSFSGWTFQDNEMINMNKFNDGYSWDINGGMALMDYYDDEEKRIEFKKRYKTILEEKLKKHGFINIEYVQGLLPIYEESLMDFSYITYCKCIKSI